MILIAIDIKPEGVVPGSAFDIAFPRIMQLDGFGMPDATSSTCGVADMPLFIPRLSRCLTQATETSPLSGVRHLEFAETNPLLRGVFILRWLSALGRVLVGLQNDPWMRVV
jgi:hypothetical protein